MGPDAPALPLIEQPATAYCVVSASHRYDLPIEGLLSILMTEGGKPGLAKENENGTFDLGVMQINTVWLKPNSPLYGYVSEDTLKNDLCVNIHAAAWILATNMKKAGDIWRAVGRYHSPRNSRLAWQYMNRVNKKLAAARKMAQSHPVYLQNIQAMFHGGSTAAKSVVADAHAVDSKAKMVDADFRALFPAQ